MPINYLLFDDYFELIIAEMKTQIPSIDPTIQGNWATGFAAGAAALASSLSLTLRDVQNIALPQTSTGEFLDLWGEYEDLERPPDTPAGGRMVFTGVDGTFVASTVFLKGENGLTYATTGAFSINLTPIPLYSLSRVGSLVTGVSLNEHRLPDTIEVTIFGADQTEYNGLHTITVTGLYSFTYEITTTPVTPATGSISVAATYGSVGCECTTEGVETNAPFTDSYSVIDPPTDVDDVAKSDFNGMTGGREEALDPEYLELILASRRSRKGIFTQPQIELIVLRIPGNTRVFTLRPTEGGAGGATDPEPGQVSVFFIRDNDPNIIPSSIQITAARDEIIAEGALPAHMAEADLFVQAPTLLPTDFTFASLLPSTASMLLAVEANLNAYFTDNPYFSRDAPESAYLSAIQNTIDPTNGDAVESFALTVPSGVITVAAGELLTVGTVS